MHIDNIINEVHVNVYSLAFVLYYIHGKEGSISHSLSHTHTHSVLHPLHTHPQSQKGVCDKEHIIEVVVYIYSP